MRCCCSTELQGVCDVTATACCIKKAPLTAFAAGCHCRRWLGPRLAAVHVLDFAVFSSVPIDPGELTLLPVVELLFSKCPAGQPLPLAKLSIEWPEAVLLRADFTPPNAPRLQHLRKLAFPTVGRLEVAACLPPDLALTDFSLQDGTLWSDRGTLAAAWLPPTVTALHLSSVGLRALPQVLTQLPHLRRQAAADRHTCCAEPCGAVRTDVVLHVAVCRFCGVGDGCAGAALVRQ